MVRTFDNLWTDFQVLLALNVEISLLSTILTEKFSFSIVTLVGLIIFMM